MKLMNTHISEKYNIQDKLHDTNNQRATSQDHDFQKANAKNATVKLLLSINIFPENFPLISNLTDNALQLSGGMEVTVTESNYYCICIVLASKPI